MLSLIKIIMSYIKIFKTVLGLKFISRQLHKLVSVVVFSSLLDLMIVFVSAPALVSMFDPVAKNIINLLLQEASISYELFIVFSVALLVFKFFTQVFVFKYLYNTAFRFYSHSANVIVKNFFASSNYFDSDHLRVKLTSELEEFVKSVLLPVLQILSELTVVLFIVIGLLIFSPMQSLYVAIFLLILILLYRFFVSGSLNTLGIRTRESRLDLLSSASHLEGHKLEIKSLNTESFYMDRLASLYTEFANTSSKYQFSLSLPRISVELIALLGLFIVVGLAVYLKLDLLQVSVFSIAIIRILPSVQRTYVSLNQVRFGSRTIDMFCESLVKPIDSASPSFLSFSFSIDPKGVTVYKGEKDACLLLGQFLPGVNLLSGKSGVGKTTLLKSLSQFLDEHSIQYVFFQQGSLLFHGSVLDNIVAGRDYDSERLFGLINFFFPEVQDVKVFLNYNLTHSGDGLSGGQAQRLGLVRSFLVKKKYYLIDEGLANIDADLAIKIVDFFKILSAEDGSTVICIDHSHARYGDCHVVSIK